MNRKDFSKPFFMSGPANSGWGGAMPRGDRWGAFQPQEPWNRYNEAYGDYQGGYGPGRGYGPSGPRPLMPPGGPMPPGGMMPPGGPMMLGGPPAGFGFGPRGPGGFGPRPQPSFARAPGPMTQHMALKFLQRCGVPAENLKNLPRELIRNYLPNHCGVCKMDFDTLAFARLHYCSKNHLKNQKKWLLETPKAGNAKEPIKSRDLYCELCDVQITSKPHADSHYAGKPHRAVVEERKPPKNPKLLLPGAKARLQQLLKREKRFVKTEPAAGAAGASKGQPQPPSEFYCEICKSAMSCSEQMTAHLNGKRHLTKEKQHILKMMKNPDDDIQVLNTTDEVVEIPDEDVEEGEAAPGNGESNGNGDDDNMEEVAGKADGESAGKGEEEGMGKGEGETKGEGEGVGEPEAAEDDSWVHGTGDDWDQAQQEEL